MQHKDEHSSTQMLPQLLREKIPSFSINDVLGKVIHGVRLLLVIPVSFALIACGLDVEDSAPPSPPQWVQKSLPEIWPERGIDAHETGGIYLEWEANPIEEDIIDYRIHRATYFAVNDSLGEFEELSIRTIASDPSCEFVDQTAQIGNKYHFKIKASDSGENTSDFSEELVYELLQKISSATMSPNGPTSPLPENRRLSWSYEYQASMEYYYLTILDNENTFVLRYRFSPGDYTGGTESWVIPSEIELIPGKRYKWRIEMGAQYLDGLETAGSESTWANFLYTE